MREWDDDIDSFIRLCHERDVKMILVGGGAVNFHGYQRHSSDVDFWIKTDRHNLDRLIGVFREMDLDISTFPEAVMNQEQNVSVKFSPLGLDLELITKFEIGKSFDEAYADAVIAEIKKIPVRRWRVLSFSDLILSKEKAARPKDLLDIQELKRLKSDTN
ncbi:MAG: nucleotidyltransferase [Bacteroidota bacterium]